MFRFHSPCRFDVLDNSIYHLNPPIHMKYFPLMQRLSLTRCTLVEVTFVVTVVTVAVALLMFFELENYLLTLDIAYCTHLPECVHIFDESDGYCLKFNAYLFC
jgi:hypothetical protein